jgi:hypothetical protein
LIKVAPFTIVACTAEHFTHYTSPHTGLLTIGREHLDREASFNKLLPDASLERGLTGLYAMGLLGLWTFVQGLRIRKRSSYF